MTAAARKRPFDLVLMDQVEAIAVAIAMALVLKYFLVEAYQIPTGSMQPTILGDAEAGIRDRVLADKLTVMLRAPRRWEVMIFRFPNDERALYVKRIVGLPDETLELAGGDVWIDGAIARKPDQVVDSVLKDVFPAYRGGKGLEIGRFFTSVGADSVSLAGDTVQFAPGPGAEMRLRANVRDEYLHGYDPDWNIRAGMGQMARFAVSDLELSLDARLAAADGSLSLRFLSDEGDLVLTLPGEGVAQPGPLAAFEPVGGGEPQALAAVPAGLSLPANRDLRVVARNVDRRVVLEVDGHEWLRLDDDVSGPRADQPRRAAVGFGLSGGGRAGAVRVRRDIYYLSAWSDSWPEHAARWAIPRDHYFALGDNTQGSLDSRKWELQTYRLSQPVRGATEVTGFWFPPASVGRPAPDANPKYLPGGKILFADTHGDEYVFARDQVESQSRAAAPFIDQRYLLGKATVVFWPVFSPFRWKLIR